MRFEVIFAVVGVALAVTALLDPQWIERLLGSSPDGGSGEAEWALSVICCSVSVLASLMAARDFLILRRSSTDAVPM